jgi:hypothetical protein
MTLRAATKSFQLLYLVILGKFYSNQCGLWAPFSYRSKLFFSSGRRNISLRILSLNHLGFLLLFCQCGLPERYLVSRSQCWSCTSLHLQARVLAFSDAFFLLQSSALSSRRAVPCEAVVFVFYC